MHTMGGVSGGFGFALVFTEVSHLWLELSP